MKTKDKALFRELIEATYEFDEAAPWECLANEHGLALEIPGEPALAYASVMGDGGEEFGLSIWRGEQAKRHLLETLSGEGAFDPDAIDEQDMAGFSMDLYADLPTELRSFLRTAGLKPKRDQMVPFFIFKGPGQNARPPDAVQARFLLYAIKGILAAMEKRLFKPAPFTDSGRLPLLRLSGEPGSPQVTVAEDTKPVPSRPAPSLVFKAPPDLGRLRQLPSTWVVGLPVLPMAIKNDSRTVRCLVLADATEGELLHMELFMSQEIFNVVNELYDFMRKKAKGTPAAIEFGGQDLFDAVGPPLRALGITCVMIPNHPFLAHVVEHLSGYMEKHPPR